MHRRMITLQGDRNGYRSRPVEAEFVQFDSISDCITAPAVREDSWKQTQDGDESRYWLGIEGGAAAIEQALMDGWPKAREMMASLTLPDIEAPESIRRKTVWGEDGDVLDLDKLRDGRMEDCWSSRKRRTRTAPRTVTLWADLGGAAGIDGTTLYYRGAAYLILTDLLEKAGYRVRINAFIAADPRNEDTTGTVICQTVKEPDMQLDVNALASVLCIMGYKRIYFHRHYYTLWGVASGLRNEFQKSAEEFLFAQYPNEMNIPGNARIDSARSASAWLAETLALVQAG